MSERNSFLNWVGFKGEESNAPSSVDRIRELESQLADLRSRRDITTLTKEEFEILATETAMTMVKSAQLREAKAQAVADRAINDSSRQAKDAIQSAEQKSKSLLLSAETRGHKYLLAAETDAQELLQRAEHEVEALLDAKKREATQFTTNARRESEKMISDASREITEYRQWLSGVITEAERLYKVQTQSLDAAESAIHQSRARLESAFLRLAELQKNVVDNLKADDTVIDIDPIQVPSERTKPVLEAPLHEPVKKVFKKTAAKRK